MDKYSNFIDEELDQIKEMGLYRELKNISTPALTNPIIGGNEYLNFCSNDYHGLAYHPKLVNYAAIAAKKWGIGSGGSRLICGNMDVHNQLEQKIAKFKGSSSALLFSSGYLTNLGILATFGTYDSTIFSDRLNHASIIDGCRLSRAKIKIYDHLDADHLERLIQADNSRKKLIVTEGVFSMDGDIAPLPDICIIKEKYDAFLIVDDAHATGILGHEGRGSGEYWGLTKKINLQMGTFSKAFGTYGGFICVDHNIREYFINKCRTFIYNTAMPPLITALTIKAIEIFQSSPEFLLKLKNNIKFFKEIMRNRGFEIESSTPIIPILVGESEKAVKISEELMERGIFISAIRPPTVPEGTARLRVSISSAHTLKQIKYCADSISNLLIKHRINNNNLNQKRNKNELYGLNGKG